MGISPATSRLSMKSLQRVTSKFFKRVIISYRVRIVGTRPGSDAGFRKVLIDQVLAVSLRSLEARTKTSILDLANGVSTQASTVPFCGH